MKNSITICISSVLVAGLIFSTSLSFSAEEELLPSWIKNTAGFWADNQISDIEFMNAIEFLIGADIIKVPEAIAQEVPNAIAQEVSEAISQEVSEAIAQEVSEAIAQEGTTSIIPTAFYVKSEEIPAKVSNQVFLDSASSKKPLQVFCDDGDTVLSGGFSIEGDYLEIKKSIPSKSSSESSTYDGWDFFFKIKDRDQIKELLYMSSVLIQTLNPFFFFIPISLNRFQYETGAFMI